MEGGRKRGEKCVRGWEEGRTSGQHMSPKQHPHTFFLFFFFGSFFGCLVFFVDIGRTPSCSIEIGYIGYGMAMDRVRDCLLMWEG